jgi:hypothetical protein
MQGFVNLNNLQQQSVAVATAAVTTNGNGPSYSAPGFLSLTHGGGAGGVVPDHGVLGQQPQPLPMPMPLQQPEQCCQGCLSLIHDRYYLLVMDKAWHLNCLRCADCKLSLDTQQSCFAKDGVIYCKNDYFK